MASLSSSVTSSSRENRQNPFEEVSRDFGKIQSNLASCQKLLSLPSPLSMPSESLRELSSNLQHYQRGSRKGGKSSKRSKLGCRCQWLLSYLSTNSLGSLNQPSWKRSFVKMSKWFIMLLERKSNMKVWREERRRKVNPLVLEKGGKILGTYQCE